MENGRVCGSVLLISPASAGWLKSVHELLLDTDWYVMLADQLIEINRIDVSVFVSLVDTISPIVERLRSNGGAVSLLPVVGIGTGAHPLLDGHLASPVSAPALHAALTPWCPAQWLATRDRLRDAFGTDQVAALLTSFRALLTEAIAADATRFDLAHRVAGIAGTLGFVDVGRTWLRLSEGDMTAAAPAIRAARRAIATLDR